MQPLLLDSLGWLDKVEGIVASALQWCFDMFADLITMLFNFLFSVIIQILGTLFGSFLRNLLYYLLAIVDVLEDMFDVFAGTKSITLNGDDTYLLDIFMTDDVIKRALVMITFIGVAVCFIFTIYSVAKSMGSYILENKRPVGKIMGTALKSCAAFMIVPIMAYFGAQLSSAILVATEQAVIGVTGTDSSPRLSTILFLSGTFGSEKKTNTNNNSANKRDTTASYNTYPRSKYFSGTSIYDTTEVLNDFYMYPSIDSKALFDLFESETDAQHVPNNAIVEAKVDKDNKDRKEIEYDPKKDSRKNGTLTDASKQFANIFVTIYDYPTVYIATIVVIIILICSMFVFIRKLIEVLILYVTSPLFVATMPLDGGATFKRWRDMFIGKLFSGFGIVISMNVAMIFIPMIMTSNFKFTDSIPLDVLLKLVFVVGCLYAAWKSNATVLEVINPEVDASDRASAAVVAGMVKMAADKAKDAAMAAATGGTSAAAKGATSAMKGASGASGAAGSAGGGNAFRGGTGGSSGGMNTGGSGGKSDGGGGSGGGLGKLVGNGEEGGGSGKKSSGSGGNSGNSDSKSAGGENKSGGGSNAFQNASDIASNIPSGSDNGDEEEKDK